MIGSARISSPIIVGINNTIKSIICATKNATYEIREPIAIANADARQHRMYIGSVRRLPSCLNRLSTIERGAFTAIQTRLIAGYIKAAATGIIVAVIAIILVIKIKGNIHTAIDKSA